MFGAVSPTEGMPLRQRFTAWQLQKCVPNEGNMGWQRQKCRPRAAFLASDRPPVPCSMVHISAAAIVVEKPHFATVRPDDNYNPRQGPLLANVSSNNGIFRPITTNVFGDKFPLSSIEWYYNKHQDFRIFLNNILKLERGGYL